MSQPGELPQPVHRSQSGEPPQPVQPSQSSQPPRPAAEQTPPSSPVPAFPSQNRKKSSLPVIIAICAAVVILAGAAAGGYLLFVKPSGDKEAVRLKEETEESTLAMEETKETESESGTPQEEEEAEEILQDEIPPVSALDHGNLFGNTHCYARMISDGENLYFRNPQDFERTYCLKKGSSTIAPFGDMYMKDLHYKDGYIYYAMTNKGDASGSAGDKNLYRIKTDGTGNMKLTSLNLDQAESWLSFDSMVDGVCYFTYFDARRDGYHIGAVNTDGTNFRDVHVIPLESWQGLPTLNILDGKIYYKTTEGLNCLDIATGVNNVVISGFSCEEFIIYDGEVYYTLSGGQGRPAAMVKAVKLDGTGEREIFASGTSDWIQYIQLNIYRGRLYFIGLANDPHVESKGNIFTCNPDGSETTLLVEHATWFNIINGTLYYRYVNSIDSQSGQREPFYSISIKDVEEKGAAADDGRKVLFDPQQFTNGWVQEGDRWYYYEAGTKAMSGWKIIEGKSYYFGEDGAMYADTVTPDGKRVGADGSLMDYDARYVDAVNNYLYSEGLYLSTEYDTVSGGSTAQFIDRGTYYELKNGCILADHLFPGSIIDGKRQGDTIELENTAYRILEIKSLPQGGQYVNLEYISGELGYYYTLFPRGAYYVLIGEDDDIYKDTLYSGSLYFSKECTATALDPANEYRRHSVSLYDYATKDHSVVGAEHGLSPYSGLQFWGYFEMDSTGLITHYGEYFVS